MTRTYTTPEHTARGLMRREPGGEVKHIDLPADWQWVLDHAAAIRRLGSVDLAGEIGLYEVDDAAGTWLYLVAELP